VSTVASTVKNLDDKPHDFNLNLVTWSWDAAYL